MAAQLTCTRILAAQRARSFERNSFALQNKRAQGRPGARRTHGPCAKKVAHGRHHRCRRIIRPSLRNGFNGVLRALLDDEFLFATVAPRIEWLHAPGRAAETSARLDTSNGCQDHTTSSSATTPFVSRAPIAHRP